MMNCRNCTAELTKNHSFCIQCGAKVIKKRITLRGMLSSLVTAFGWENNFLLTLRHLIYQPHVVAKEYIAGTRKRYTNPFSFLAIMLSLSYFVINEYQEKYVQLSTEMYASETSLGNSGTENDKGFQSLGFKNQFDFQQELVRLQIKYNTPINFVLLPFYTLIAFLVFRKPYNFGEHLLICTYLQGIYTFFLLLIFLLSLVLGQNIFLTGSLIIPLVVYSLTYKKLYRLSIYKLMLKMLRFFAVLLLVMIIFGILSFGVGILIGYLHS